MAEKSRTRRERLLFLLNSHQIKHHVLDRPWQGYLDIENFNERRLQHTSYYFSMGDRFELWENGEFKPQSLGPAGTKLFLHLPPGGYAKVWTREIFHLSDKVMGIFGNISTFVESGIELVNAPFIDPHFHRALKVGLRNRLDTPQEIHIDDPIGKIAFFDISDTYPVHVIGGSDQEPRLGRAPSSKEYGSGAGQESAG